jgi:AcrR family transcriptional regulator
MGSKDAPRSYDMALRTRRAETTAERIREAGWSRFSKRGYDEVSLAEVAEAAAVSVPTVRAHFANKERLFLAGYVVWGMAAIENREAARQADPVAAVRSLLKDYERQGTVGLHLLAEEDRFPAVREMTDGGRAYHRWWLSEVFADHLAGLTPGIRRRRVAQLFLATDVRSWKLLRIDLGLSPGRTEAAVLENVAALTAQR